MNIDERFVAHIVKRFKKLTNRLLEDIESKDEVDKMFAWNRMYMILASVEQQEIFMKLGIKTGVRFCTLYDEDYPSMALESWMKGSHPLYDDSDDAKGDHDQKSRSGSGSILEQLEGVLDALIKETK